MKAIYIILIIVVVVAISIFAYSKLKPKEKTITNNDTKPKANGKKFNGKCFETAEQYQTEMNKYLNSESGKNSEWGKQISEQATQKNVSYSDMVKNNVKYFINENWNNAQDCVYQKPIL